MCVRVCVGIGVYVCVCMGKCVYVWRVCMCVCVWGVCMCVYMCVCIGGRR